MAGSITVSSITLDSDNNFSIRSNTGATILSANGTGLITGIASGSAITNAQLTTPTVSGNLNLDSTGTSGVRLPAANTLTFHTAGTEDMRITSTGIIAVGTTTPNTTNKLEISGNVGISWAGNTFIGMKFNDGNSYKMGMQLNNVTRETLLWSQSSDSDDKITFYTGSGPTERMRITSGGNVGIGTTSPSNPLHIVNSGANVNLLSLVGTNTYTGTSLAGEGPFRFQNTNTTNGNMSSFSNYDGNGNLNSQLNFINANHSGTGSIAFTTRNGGSYPEAMRITFDSRVFVGATDTPGGSNPVKFGAVGSATGDHIGSFVAATTSYTSQAFIIGCTRSASSGFNIAGWYSGDGGNSAFQDREFAFRGDGQGYADGTWNNNGADYAEFFESATGQAIPVGSTVVLDGNKVRLAIESDNADDVIGVVRPKEPSKASMVVGNTAWNKWANKYLTDDFDRYIMEDHNTIEWTDADGKQQSYESHNIPQNVVVPNDATVKTHDENGKKFQHYKLNPAWNPDAEYVNRENRDEWLIIGLVGQVKILKEQKINSRWIKMKNVSASVEEWFIR